MGERTLEMIAAVCRSILEPEEAEQMAHLAVMQVLGEARTMAGGGREARGQLSKAKWQPRGQEDPVPA